MPGEAEGLQIPVSFTLEEARAALKQLEQAAREAGKRAGAGFDEAASGKGGKGGIAGLKEGMGKAREQVMFFTSALTEFGPQGRVAQSAITGIAGAFLGGGGLLLALEGARIAFTFFAEESKKAKEAARIFAEDGLKYVQETANAASTAVDALDAAKARGLLNAATREADKLRAKIEAADDDDREKLERELGQAELRIASLRERIPVAEINARQKALEERKKTERDLAREIQTIRLDAYDQEKRLAIQAEQAKQDALHKYAALGMAKVAEAQQEIDRKLYRDIIAQREKDGLDLFNAIVGVREQVVAKIREQPAFTIQDFLFGVGNKAPKGSAYAEGGRDLSKEYDKLLGSPVLGDQGAFEARLAKLDREWDKTMALADAYANVKAEVRGLGEQAVHSFAGDLGRSLTAVTRQSAAYERAMRAAGGATEQSADLSAAAFAAFAQNAIASVAQESATRAVFETAMGFAALARSYWDPSATKDAGLHFAAAAEFGVVSVAAGAAAYGIGQTRGMTGAERASVRDVQASGEVAPSGPREVGAAPAGSGRGGPTIIVNISGRALVTEPEVKRYLADLMKETRDAGWN
jgi:hypothetical protein